MAFRAVEEKAPAGGHDDAAHPGASGLAAEASGRARAAVGERRAADALGQRLADGPADPAVDAQLHVRGLPAPEPDPAVDPRPAGGPVVDHVAGDAGGRRGEHDRLLDDRLAGRHLVPGPGHELRAVPVPGARVRAPGRAAARVAPAEHGGRLLEVAADRNQRRGQELVGDVEDKLPGAAREPVDRPALRRPARGRGEGDGHRLAAGPCERAAEDLDERVGHALAPRGCRPGDLVRRRRGAVGVRLRGADLGRGGARQGRSGEARHDDRGEDASPRHPSASGNTHVRSDPNWRADTMPRGSGARCPFGQLRNRPDS